MDWFHRLTGFPEASYAETRSRLVIEGETLRSLVNGRSFGIGRLELASLATLRARVTAGSGPTGRLTVRTVTGDVRQMHQAPAFAGALFQVASQFNLLEMKGAHVTPEQGVTRYENDHTQGPACAIAAGAATIYRNYFVPVQGEAGQTAARQIDCLQPLGAALADTLAQPVTALWRMRNGYALCTAEGLQAIGTLLAGLDAAGIDRLRGLLQIGLHQDVEVTDVDSPPGPLVSQAFCSALPVAYGRHPVPLWRPFATLVLEAAYEATLLAAVLNARRGASRIVLLTRLGGGVFGNDDGWIDAAMRRALHLVRDAGLDVRLVSHGTVSAAMTETARMFA